VSGNLDRVVKYWRTVVEHLVPSIARAHASTTPRLFIKQHDLMRGQTVGAPLSAGHTARISQIFMAQPLSNLCVEDRSVRYVAKTRQGMGKTGLFLRLARLGWTDGTHTSEYRKSRKAARRSTKQGHGDETNDAAKP